MRALVVALIVLALVVPAAMPSAAANHACDPDLRCTPHSDDALGSLKPVRTLIEKFVPNLCA